LVRRKKFERSRKILCFVYKKLSSVFDKKKLKEKMG